MKKISKKQEEILMEKWKKAYFEWEKIIYMNQLKSCPPKYIIKALIEYAENERDRIIDDLRDDVLDWEREESEKARREVKE